MSFTQSSVSRRLALMSYRMNIEGSAYLGMLVAQT